MERFRDRGGWWVIAQVGLLAFFGLAMIGAAPSGDGGAPGPVQFVGAVLIVAAVLVGGWTFWLVGRNLTPYPAPTKHAVLIERGPYAYVRHPMYGAVALVTLGFALIALNPWAVLFSLTFVPFFMAKSGDEERMLVDRFPGYREYRSRVRYRLIPWVI